MTNLITSLGGPVYFIAELVAFLAGVIAIFEYLTRRFNLQIPFKKSTFTSEDLYKEYQKATKDEEIWIQTGTWPVFLEYESCFIGTDGSESQRIFIIGPVEKFYTLPGVLWRLMIKNTIENDPLRKMNLYHISEIPSIVKFILRGDRFYEAVGKKRGVTSYKIKDNINSAGIQQLKDTLLNAIYIDGEDALLKIYKMVEGLLGANERIPIEQFISRIITDYRNSCQEYKHVISKEHKKISKKELEELFQKTLPLLVKYIEKNYGIRTIIISTDGRNVNKASSPRARFEEDIDRLNHNEVTPIRRLPSMRIVINGSCNLNCIYCPFGNESYSLTQIYLEASTLKSLLDISYKKGFREFAITGGEPRFHPKFIDILDIVRGFLNDNKKDSTLSISINTNAYDVGTHFTFENLLSELELFKDRIDFKVSLDGLRNRFSEKINLDEEDKIFLKKYPKIDHSDKILENVRKALAKQYRIGLNFVLTQSNRTFLKETLECSYGLYKDHKDKDPKNLYFKILDLNWYHDIGNRHKEPDSYYFWRKEYVSPLQYYDDERLKDIFGIPKHILNINFGVPMVEVDKEGFKIRIKDSSLGTHYCKKYCISCLFYIKNLCQEGVYQPWITPEGNLKMCYHRPDIIKSELLNEDVLGHPEILDEFKNHFLGELKHGQRPRL